MKKELMYVYEIKMIGPGERIRKSIGRESDKSWLYSYSVVILSFCFFAHGDQSILNLDFTLCPYAINDHKRTQDLNLISSVIN